MLRHFWLFSKFASCPDENIGRCGVELLTWAGHDVMTVRVQNIHGVSDETLFNVRANKDRVLIILDHDFGQAPRFPPESGAGLIILEPGARVTPRSLLDRLRYFLALADVRSPSGTLWIVEPGRVRVHLHGGD
jgi:hypothetical protein